MKAKQTFVLCYQKVPNICTEIPFEAEFVSEVLQRCRLKYKGKEFMAHRQACSTVPYTKKG